MSKLSENIRFYRKACKLTQSELAEKLGIVRTAITNYETDRNIPDLDMLIKLADVFDVSLDDLAGRDY